MCSAGKGLALLPSPTGSLTLMRADSHITQTHLAAWKMFGVTESTKARLWICALLWPSLLATDDWRSNGFCESIFIGHVYRTPFSGNLATARQTCAPWDSSACLLRVWAWGLSIPVGKNQSLGLYSSPLHTPVPLHSHDLILSPHDFLPSCCYSFFLIVIS